MPSALTAISVDRAKPDAAKRRELPDGALPGLYFVLQPSGARSWAVRYRHGGRPRKLTLGAYPALDLVEARRRARESLQALATGRDPGAEKLEAKRLAKDGEADQDLVSGAVESFVKRHVRPNTSRLSAETTERLFALHVLPSWRTRRLDSITRRDVVVLLDKVVDGGAPVGANRVLGVVRKFFNWCVDRGLLDQSPAIRVKPPTEETSRDRVLTDTELRLLWLAADKVGPPFGPFVRTLLLTAQRRDEVARMRRVERRADLWTIPGERTKTGVAQDVPLPAGARDVLDGVPIIAGATDFVFTSDGDTAFSGFSKCKARLDREMLAIARREAEDAGADSSNVAIPPWRLHDLRRTAATGMARLGVAVHVIEAVLNHVSGQVSGVAAVYNRHKYLEEKRAALEAWAGYVNLVTEMRKALISDICARSQT